MRHLGIDYGTKRIGLALSDEAGTMGFPHATVPNDMRVMEYVRTLITKEEVGVVIIGDSRNFQGEENPVAINARAFGTALQEETGLPVFYEAEMLSTQEARRTIDGARGKGYETVDASAAALVLTSYLSRNHD